MNISGNLRAAELGPHYISQGNLGIGTVSPSQKLHVEGQCVTGDTILSIFEKDVQGSTPNHSLRSGTGHGFKVQGIKIKDVQPGMMVYSLNEELGIIEPHRIIALLDMGIKPVFKLITEDGRNIRTTGNHPYLVRVKGRGSRNLHPVRNFTLTENKNGISNGVQVALSVTPEHLSGDYEFKDTKVMWKLSPFVEEDYSEVYHKDQNGNHIENNISHGVSPLTLHCPQIEDKRQYSSKDIKGQEIHSLSFFDNFIAMIKNDAVMAMPIENVNHGILPVAPGTNAPTTSEANKIFAPSRKKSGIISRPSLDSIQPKSTIQSPDCQEVKWEKAIADSKGIIV